MLERCNGNTILIVECKESPNVPDSTIFIIIIINVNVFIIIIIVIFHYCYVFCVW